MSQLVITEANYIDGYTLRGALPEKIALSGKSFKIGLCYINLLLPRLKTRKIFIASDSVSGFQPFQNRFLLGSFINKNTGSHFYSESLTPQIFASLLNVNSIAISLHDENGKIIPKTEVDHISMCLVMLEGGM